MWIDSTGMAADGGMLCGLIVRAWQLMGECYAKCLSSRLLWQRCCYGVG